MKTILLVFLSLSLGALAATPTPLIKNDQVIATEETLRPGQAEAAGNGLPSITVFLSDGVVQRTPDGGKPVTTPVKRGEVIFRRPRDGKLTATGAAEMRLVRVEFSGAESKVVWGTTGFGPDSKMLVENGYVRAYDIRIPAGKNEPQHTHHDRVVVCLSGAQLRHLLPDGHEEDSTIKTGECLWRRGQTHIGKNIGATDLWVIAIEPK